MTSQIEFNKCLSRGLVVFNGTPRDVSEKIKTIAAELGIEHKVSQFPDYIDPFNAMAFYNRTIKIEKRNKIAARLIEWLDLDCDVPTVESAIPLPNYARLSFVDRRVSDRDAIVDEVWRMFRIFISFADNMAGEEEFIEAFNKCRTIKGMAKDPCRQLAMGLYWVDCDRFVSIDKHIENYLIKHHNYDADLFREIDGQKYLDLVKQIHETIHEDPSLESFDRLSSCSYDSSEGSSWEVYDPGITKEVWSSLLKDGSVFREDSIHLMDCIIKLGGEASCVQLANAFGGTSNTYNTLSWNLAKRVHEATDCLLCPTEDGNGSYWPILFEGRVSNPGEEGTYIWRIRKELREAIDENPGIIGGERISDNHLPEFELNTIFYGPPGTGKTYGTVKAAVEIIDGKASEDYDQLKKRYDELCAANRIRSVTFHQSYGYEEFIEGIKPVLEGDDDGESKDVRYELVNGVFKSFCNSIASTKAPAYGIRDNPVVWKVSLEGTGDNETRRECLENGHIRVGFDQYGENITGEMNYADGGKDVLNAFISKMSVGDIVFSCYSSRTIDAIGVVTGEYEWHDEYSQYKRVRAVKWIKKFGKNARDIVDVNGGVQMTLSTVYRLSRISVSDVYEMIDIDVNAAGDRKYVFIIDEINRGNVSRIFGELITLLETSKRRGNREAAYVELPYSNERFSVPNNLYILGTMNTADRSLVTLDTALRRRFDFVEMMPDSELIDEVISGIDIKSLFMTINKRIEALYDREHTIGHSFFMNIRTMNDLEKTFKKNVLPLLQEYFHDDYEKILMVLSKKSDSCISPFVKKVTESPFKNYDGDDLQIYRLDIDALAIPDNYIMIYDESL